MNSKIRWAIRLHYKNEIAQIHSDDDKYEFVSLKMDKLKKKHGRRKLY